MAGELNGIIEELVNSGVEYAMGQIDAQQLELHQKLIQAAETFRAHFNVFTESSADYMAELQEFINLKNTLRSDGDPTAAETILKKREEIRSMIYASNLPQLLENVNFAMLALQGVMNEILGQTMEVAYVFGKGKGTSVYIINAADFQQIVQTFPLGASLRTLVSATKKKLEEIAQQVKADEDLSKNQYNLLAAYNEALARYEISRSVGNHVILVNIGNGWEVFSVVGRGDLREAYAHALMNLNSTMFMSGSEQNLYEFLTGWVAQVDATSGMLTGDFTKDGIEYAVKSAGASLMELGQFVDVADAILSNQGFTNWKAAFTQLKSQQKKEGRNKFVQVAEKELDELKEMYQKELNKSKPKINIIIT